MLHSYSTDRSQWKYPRTLTLATLWQSTLQARMNTNAAIMNIVMNEWKRNWVDKSLKYQLHVFHPDQISVKELNWAAIICSIHMNKIFIN